MQTSRSLQDILDSGTNIVDHLFRNPKSTLAIWTATLQPAPHVLPEFTNWQDEQRASVESVALADQSFHMVNFYVRGRDAVRLLERLGVNSFKNFGPGKAKQFVACAPSGHMVGDQILYCLEPETLLLVGLGVDNWVEYHAVTGGYDVTVERDPIYVLNPSGRRTLYRFQIEGPNATALLEAVTGGPLPEIKFFNFVELKIANCPVWVLRHSMTGTPGFELSGPWDDREHVLGALLDAGERFDLKRVGSLAYFPGGLPSGWFAVPLPAIYTGEELRPYREWLPATAMEATLSLGGSFYSPNIEDYYVTPYELGYERIVKFDHDFIGREALERMAGQPHRRKVTLVWNTDDVLELQRAAFFDSDMPAKRLDFPMADYAMWKYDRVQDPHGNIIGVSKYTGYLATEKAVVSLALVPEEYATPGSEVVVVWGDNGGGSRSGPWIERHREFEVRARVAPVPLSRVAQEYWATVKPGR